MVFVAEGALPYPDPTIPYLGWSCILTNRIILIHDRIKLVNTFWFRCSSWVSSQFGAFHFGARQFDACQFGAFHFDAVPVWRVSVWRDASLARCQFGAFHFGAFPILVSMLIQYSRQFSFFSAKPSLARVAYLFVRMFHFSACFLRRNLVYASLPRSHSTRPTLARVSLSAYFSFIYASYCLRHIFINHLNASSGYSMANLFIAGVFLCLVHTFINHFRTLFIREDQGEVITSD